MNHNDPYDESDYLFAQARLGIELQAHEQSAQGKYLIARAVQHLAQARDELETVNVYEKEAVLAAQNKAAVARNFLTWLAEGIRAGEQAEWQLRQSETNG